IHDDECAYFQAALDWMATEFGSANLLSAVVHKDESAQHMHVLIVPLVQGSMQGSDLLGGKAQTCIEISNTSLPVVSKEVQAHFAVLRCRRLLKSFSSSEYSYGYQKNSGQHLGR
ncbi:plasmid recombination protein, partial [Comamonas aquatica]|uniref:plasmid recombination protein n=1 Tax=Comamonas aquatica TaxID=225991 RepID=UPI0034D5E764